MNESAPHLRILDLTGPDAAGLDLASELFHRINRIIPENQRLLTVPPSCPVRDAIELMRKQWFSQLPVVDGDQVLGVFSYRSFALKAARAKLDDFNREKCAPGDLRVDDFMEAFDFARVTEEMSQVFNTMERDNGVLIGTPENLIGMLTPMDFLRYLYQLANPFVMLSEIELALRALIRRAMTDEEIEAAAKIGIPSGSGVDCKIPLTLEHMTFDNYRALISRGENWSRFEPVFGGTRNRTSGKLQEIGLIRNDVFHFKRQITMEDHETLADHRNWLLAKVKQARATKPKEKSS